MATLVGTQKTEAAYLAEAYALEVDVADAYDTALTRLQGHAPRAHVARLAEAHRQRMAALQGCIAAAGGQVPQGPDLKGLLTRGKVLLVANMGDYSIVKALLGSEEDTVTAYARGAEHPELAASTRELVRRLHVEAQGDAAAIADLQARIDMESSEAASREESLGAQDAQLRAPGSRGEWLEWGGKL